MEDTLRESIIISLLVGYIVLILVLMEDTLRASKQTTTMTVLNVLILVLMEDTLRGLLRRANNSL